MAIEFNGLLPVNIGDFGSGLPLTTLSTIQQVTDWININIIGKVDNSTTVYTAPMQLMLIDTDNGGTYVFYSPTNEPCTSYEYRTKKNDEIEFSNWATCTSFRISLDNADYFIESIEVRHKAGDKASSPVLSNNSEFMFHEFPINILSIGFEGYVLKVTFVSQEKFIRIVSNGHQNEGSGPFNDYPNPSIITKDFSAFKSSFQRIQLEPTAGGYRTPIDDTKYSITVPN